MRIVFGRSKDTRIVVVYGYARLMTYDKSFNLQSDILANVEVKEGQFLHLDYARASVVGRHAFHYGRFSLLVGRRR